MMHLRMIAFLPCLLCKGRGPLQGTADLQDLKSNGLSVSHRPKIRKSGKCFLTIWPNHGKSAFHVNSEVEIPEQCGAPRVPEVHIHEPQDGWGHRLGSWESEDVLRILLDQLRLAESLDSFDSGLNEGGSLGIESELVNECLCVAPKCQQC